MSCQCTESGDPRLRPEPCCSGLVDGILLKGDSAYDVAVKNGFEGTESEWLQSLKANFNDEIAQYAFTIDRNDGTGVTAINKIDDGGIGLILGIDTRSGSPFIATDYNQSTDYFSGYRALAMATDLNDAKASIRNLSENINLNKPTETYPNQFVGYFTSEIMARKPSPYSQLYCSIGVSDLGYGFIKDVSKYGETYKRIATDEDISNITNHFLNEITLLKQEIETLKQKIK